MEKTLCGKRVPRKGRWREIRGADAAQSSLWFMPSIRMYE